MERKVRGVKRWLIKGGERWRGADRKGGERREMQMGEVWVWSGRSLAAILRLHQARQTKDRFIGGGKPLVKSGKRERCCSHRLQRAGSNWQGSVNPEPSKSSQLIRADFLQSEL